MVKSGTDLVDAKSAIADAIAGDACAFGPSGNDLADRDVEIGGAQAGVTPKLPFRARDGRDWSAGGAQHLVQREMNPALGEVMIVRSASDSAAA